MTTAGTSKRSIRLAYGLCIVCFDTCAYRHAKTSFYECAYIVNSRHILTKLNYDNADASVCECAASFGQKFDKGFLWCAQDNSDKAL